MRYLALGDSYTICTGASNSSHSWPSIVANRLMEQTGRKVDVTNPAVDGFTTLDLIDKELGFLRSAKPQLVSILIGVNDLVQGRTPDQYHATLTHIYDAVAALNLPAGRVVGISIPNWSVVPAARDYGDPDRLRRLTEAFNSVAQAEAEKRGFMWVDITSASTARPQTPGWISSDRLHPGDAQYAAWADVIWKAVQEAWIAVGA